MYRGNLSNTGSKKLEKCNEKLKLLLPAYHPTTVKKKKLRQKVFLSRCCCCMLRYSAISLYLLTVRSYLLTGARLSDVQLCGLVIGIAAESGLYFFLIRTPLFSILIQTASILQQPQPQQQQPVDGGVQRAL